MTYLNQQHNFLRYNPTKPTFKPITDEWRRWVAENKLLGASDVSVVEVLIRHGIDARAAQLEVEAVVFHPYFQIANNFVQALAKLQSHLNIQTQLAQLSPQPW